MRSFIVMCPLAVVVAALGGCGSSAPAPGPELTAVIRQSIQGGTNDTTHTFAVGIFLNLGGGVGAICSGALLAPNLVATARHCVAPPANSKVDCTSQFPSVQPLSEFSVTNGSTINFSGGGIGVSKIVVPAQSSFCGNDIALMILSKNIQIPQYVTPVLDPPMTDHKQWATTITQIGYGITDATDTNGTTAGVRRIKENTPLVCIPNDTAFVDCFASGASPNTMSPNEFAAGQGTCEGDSGSSAYDQTQFDQGQWVSFGVLSRGPLPTDATCPAPNTYTRFDAWADLIRQTAQEAASAGGYTPPAWVNGGSSSSSSGSSGGSSGGSGSSSGASTGLADGTSCTADAQCAGQNCVSTDGKTFVCATACGTGNSCGSGEICNQGYCFSAFSTSSASQHPGCAVAPNPTQPVPWAVGGLALAGAVGLASRRRTSRRR